MERNKFIGMVAHESLEAARMEPLQPNAQIPNDLPLRSSLQDSCRFVPPHSDFLFSYDDFGPQKTRKNTEGIFCSAAFSVFFCVFRGPYPGLFSARLRQRRCV